MKFKTLVLERLDDLMTRFKLFKLLLMTKLSFSWAAFFNILFLVMI